MERSEILEMMAALQLSGMRAAYDETVATGIKRKHGLEQIIGALLKAELAEKAARSIRYQPGNPQNSIVMAEEWSGLRVGLPVLPEYDDPEPIDISHLRPGRG